MLLRSAVIISSAVGNPKVILIDEFSTGIDAKMKREMWGKLKTVARGKAVIITTREYFFLVHYCLSCLSYRCLDSMEEAAALANKIGIISKQILGVLHIFMTTQYPIIILLKAIGRTDVLANRFATYEVHFSCPTQQDVAKAQEIMARVLGSKMADDVATRFEIPLQEGITLSQIFHLLSESKDVFSEYTVEKSGLESVFLKVIRGNNVLEEESGYTGGRRRKFWFC